MHRAVDIFKIWTKLGSRGLAQLPTPLTCYCDSHETNPYRDIADFLLWAYGPQVTQWIDAEGSVKESKGGLAAAGNIIRDIALMPYFIIYHRRQIERLAKIPRRQLLYQADRPFLYLRMDHTFGAIAGGALAHTIGVLNGLNGKLKKALIISSDKIQGLSGEFELKVVRPQYKSGRNIPILPQLNYTDQVYRYIIDNNIVAGAIYSRESLGNYAALKISRSLNAPYICEYNGSSTWVARNWDKKSLKFGGLLARIEHVNLTSADLVVVVSDPLKMDLIERGVPENRILVNPNGVDPLKFHPARDGSWRRKELGLRTSDIVVGFAGTFGQWHGVEVLAEAFGRLMNRNGTIRESARLLLIGDGPNMAAVRDVLGSYGVLDYVSFAGLVSHEAMPEYLGACDILASPQTGNPDGSRFFGSPTKLFEYMAMGRAIIASDLDQIGEIIQHGVSGWKVAPGAIGELADGIQELIKNPNLREALGTAARQMCLTRFTWDSHVRILMEKIVSL